MKNIGSSLSQNCVEHLTQKVLIALVVILRAHFSLVSTYTCFNLFLLLPVSLNLLIYALTFPFVLVYSFVFIASV